MKRSEMIEKLEARINQGQYQDYTHSTEEVAEILTYLESLGMAPPEVAEPCQTTVLVATPQGYVEQRVEDSTVFVRKWEQE